MVSLTQSHRQRLLIALGGATALLLLFSACAQRPPGHPSSGLPAQLANQFVGNDACSSCHPSEFQQHHASRHALALRPMDRSSLGHQAPATGPIGVSGFELTALGDGYGFGRVDGPPHPLHFVFGSGKSGFAFASIPMDGVLAEAHMSYYPPMKRWFVTPGQQDLPLDSLGNVSSGDAARQCLGCHTVTLPEDTLAPERRFMGVGCESCHGPGGAHVAAMQRGDGEQLFMERMGSWGGSRINEMCGRCHRTEQQVLSKGLSVKHTDLFQAHGLAQSACFRQSKDKLTCLTCHDPHTDASTDPHHYVTVCLQCHSSGPGTGDAVLLRASICPVNARDRCLECHMPKVAEPLFPGQPRNIADHYIRVRTQSGSGRRPRAPAAAPGHGGSV